MLLGEKSPKRSKETEQRLYCVEIVLTERQFKIMLMRAKGCTLGEIAKKLGVTRQSVSVTERRIRKKVEASEALVKFHSMLIAKSILVFDELEPLNIANKVIEEGNIRGIKIKATVNDIVSIVKTECSQGPIIVLVMPTGKIKVMCKDDLPLLVIMINEMSKISC